MQLAPWHEDERHREGYLLPLIVGWTISDILRFVVLKLL